MKAAIGALILAAALCAAVMIRADESSSPAVSGPVVAPLQRPADHTVRLEYPSSVVASVNTSAPNTGAQPQAQKQRGDLFSKFGSEESLPKAPEPLEPNRPLRLPPVYAAKPSLPSTDDTVVAGSPAVVAPSPDRATSPTEGLPGSNHVRGQETRAQQDASTSSQPDKLATEKEKSSPWQPIQAAFKQMTAPMQGSTPPARSRKGSSDQKLDASQSQEPSAKNRVRGRQNLAQLDSIDTPPTGSSVMSNSTGSGAAPAAPTTKFEALPPWKTYPAQPNSFIPPSEIVMGDGSPPPVYGGHDGGLHVPKSNCGYCSPAPPFGCCTCQSVRDGGPGCNCGSNGVCSNCGGTCGGKTGGCGCGKHGCDGDCAGNCAGGQPSNRINGNGIGITGTPAYGSCVLQRLACCLSTPYPDCSNGCVDFCHSWIFHEDCHWCTSNHKCIPAGCPEYPHGGCAGGANGCGCGCAQCVPPPDLYFTADAFIVTRNNEAINQPLVTQSGTGDTLLTSGDIDFAYEVGPNLTLGYRPTPWDAWEVTYFGLMDWDSRNSLTGAADLNLPGALGSALDLNFTNADRMNITYSSVIHNGEFNYLWTHGQVMWLVGFRYFHLGEELDILSASALGATAYDVTTNNDLYGGQLGARYRAGWKRFNWDFFGKVGVFGNRSIQEQFVSNVGGIPIRDTHVTKGNTAFVGDIGVNFTYSLSKCWSVRGGYNAIWVEDVALAPDQLDFTDTLTSGTTISTGGGVFLHGAHAGIGCRW